MVSSPQTLKSLTLALGHGHESIVADSSSDLLGLQADLLFRGSLAFLIDCPNTTKSDQMVVFAGQL